MVEFDLGFGGKKKPQGQPTGVESDTVSRVRDLNARLNTLEDSLNNLRKKVQITDSNLISKSKHLDSEIKATFADMKDIRRDVIDIKDKISLMFKELKVRATSDDVKVLKRYIEMWDPIKFVSKNEIDAIIDEKLSQRTQKQK
ncbi:hypothetical protein ACFLZX_03585 [Nanoarchaeota archaeon]